jgi:hypothetical protein
VSDKEDGLSPQNLALIVRIVPSTLRLFFTGIRVREAAQALLDAARAEGLRPQQAVALAGEVEKALADLVRDSLATDFNEHWESFKAATAILSALRPQTGGEDE